MMTMQMQSSMAKSMVSSLSSRQSVASAQSIRLSRRQMTVRATGSDPKVRTWKTCSTLMRQQFETITEFIYYDRHWDPTLRIETNVRTSCTGVPEPVLCKLPRLHLSMTRCRGFSDVQSHYLVPYTRVPTQFYDDQCTYRSLRSRRCPHHRSLPHPSHHPPPSHHPCPRWWYLRVSSSHNR